MNEEAIRADEREQIADMLQAWANGYRMGMTDWEVGYRSAFLKASRLVRGDDE